MAGLGKLARTGIMAHQTSSVQSRLNNKGIAVPDMWVNLLLHCRSKAAVKINLSLSPISSAPVRM